MSSESESELFQLIQVGNMNLQHRVAMAPLSRFRASETHIISELTVEYYGQRASVPGTLLIAEATYVAEKAGGLGFVAGIWNDEQIEVWSKVTDAVHTKGSYIFCQIWAVGRAANTAVLERLNLSYVSASDVTHLDSTIKPRPLTVDEIHEYVEHFAQAARNAVKAGFDGAEVHGANGYLVDQFLQDVTNMRTDEYGITKAIGGHRTAIRLSPWETANGMGMKNPIPTFSYLVCTIKERFPDFAYIHATEKPVSGEQEMEWLPGYANDFIRDIGAPKPLIVAGGFTRDSALEAAATRKGNIIAACRRYFITSPDLPLQVQKNIPFNKYNRTTFYTPGAEGYIDYPFSKEGSQANL